MKLVSCPESPKKVWSELFKGFCYSYRSTTYPPCFQVDTVVLGCDDNVSHKVHPARLSVTLATVVTLVADKIVVMGGLS